MFDSNLFLKKTDYIMYTFLKNYKKSFSCVVLFPTNKDLPSDIVNKFNIIYTKTIDKYENNFKKNFIEMLYFTEKWCVNGGAINKASACFRHQGKIQILFIEKKRAIRTSTNKRNYTTILQ